MWIHIISVQAKNRRRKKNLSSCKLKDRWTEFHSGFTLQHISWYIFYLCHLHLCFSLSPPSDTASHMALHAPIILSEEATSTFKHVKIKHFLADSVAHLRNPRTPANRSHASAAYLFLQITAATAATVPSSSPTPLSKHARSTHLHINIIRHACTSLLLWWMTFGDSGSEPPLLCLISHCHKSIRERGMFDVFISPRSFGATGLTSSCEDVSVR